PRVQAWLPLFAVYQRSARTPSADTAGYGLGGDREEDYVPGVGDDSGLGLTSCRHIDDVAPFLRVPDQSLDRGRPLSHIGEGQNLIDCQEMPEPDMDQLAPLVLRRRHYQSSFIIVASPVVASPPAETFEIQPKAWIRDRNALGQAHHRFSF